jgi:arylsulfatase I/J
VHAPGKLLYNGEEDAGMTFDDVTSKGCYFDLHHDNSTAPGFMGVYNTFLFRDRAIQLMHNRVPGEPMFLYVAFNAVHSPVSAPSDTYSKYPELKRVKFGVRKRFAAALRLVDDSVADIVNALKETGMYENSVVIVSSDNGANPENGGSNQPLRGSKGYLFEGGIRVPAFIHSVSHIPDVSRGSTFKSMFHIVDWMPTIIEGILQEEVDMKLVGDSHIDGVNLWPALVADGEPPRDEMLLNIDYLDGSLAYGSQPLGYDTAALIHGPWKLIVNSGELDWYEVPTSTDGIVSLWSNEVVNPHTYLFNILDDPEERTNVAEAYPHIVDRLLKRIASYRKTMVACEWRGDDQKAFEQVRATGFVGPWYQTNEGPPKSSNCQDGINLRHSDARFIKSNIKNTDL